MTGDYSARDRDDYSMYERLADISNGHVHRVKKNEVEKLTGALLSEDIDKRFTNIEYYSAVKERRINFTVDISMEKLIIIASGGNVTVNISGNDANLTKKIVKIIDFENVQIVEISNPIPGIYNLHSNSDITHTMTLSAIASLKMDYRFATNIPLLYDEISFQPLVDIKNGLIIRASNETIIGNLTSADFYFNKMTNNFSSSLRAVSLENGLKVFVTEKLYLPADSFRIHVNYKCCTNKLKDLIILLRHRSTAMTRRVIESEDLYQHQFVQSKAQLRR